MSNEVRMGNKKSYEGVLIEVWELGKIAKVIVMRYKNYISLHAFLRENT